MRASATDLQQRLQATGLRVTVPRTAVLRAVHARPHADVGAIVADVRSQTGWISVQGTYDVLDALTKAGLLRRIQPAHSAARFEVEHGDNHHHVACRTCGDLRDVACATGTSPCLDPSDDLGYTIDEAEIVFWGTCPRCGTTEVTEPTKAPTHPSDAPTHQGEENQ